MKRLLTLVLVSCGSPRHTETVVVPLPSGAPSSATTHSLVVVAPPTPSGSPEAPPADTTPAVVHSLPPSDAPFDRGAAAQMLGRASATLLGCRDPSGPSGSGHVRVTFTPSGQVSRADVDPPFAGTSVGRCIEKMFEVIQVPAFTGSAVIVGKAFTLPP